MNKCENCEFFKKVADASESAEKDCMWEILRDEGTSRVPPCEVRCE